MSRIDSLRAQLNVHGIDAVLVTSRRMCTISPASAVLPGHLLISGDQQWLVTDFRYFLQAEAQAPDWTLVRVSETFVATVRTALQEIGVSAIGYEPTHLTVALYRQYGGDDPEVPYTLMPAPGISRGIAPDQRGR